MATEYKRLEVKAPPRKSVMGAEPAEKRFWSKFKSPSTTQCFAPVSAIEFSPTSPHDMAVTSSTRVQIFDSASKSVKQVISRFKDVVYGPSFRKDGKLLAVGGEEKVVKVFEVGSRAILRTFKGHENAVRVTRFADTSSRLYSASDDATIRLWDMATENEVFCFKDHEDYIRALQLSPSSPPLFLTGSYDHTIKLWDERLSSSASKNGSNVVLTMNHESPVEAVLFLPGAGLVASAGGNSVKIWDILGGGRLLNSIECHKKAVTSLCFDGTGARLLSSSLDHFVKVYDLATFQVTHSMNMHEPVLAMNISPDNTTMAVGLESGTLTIRNRKVGAVEAPELVEKKRIMSGTYRYFLRGQSSHPGSVDFRVFSQHKPKLQNFDVFLKQFDYSQALDAAVAGGNPLVICALLEELINRDGLHQALSGRDSEDLDPILAFVSKHIADPRFASLLLQVGEIIFDLYVGVLGRSARIDQLFYRMHNRMREELVFQKRLMELQGTLELLMSTSTMNRGGGALDEMDDS